MRYFGLSTWTKLAAANRPAAWQDPALRFWSVTHISLMLTAIMVAAHLPRANFAGHSVCDVPSASLLTPFFNYYGFYHNLLGSIAPH
jgi:hypothetical protein